MPQIYVATVLESVTGIGPNGKPRNFTFPKNSLLKHARESGNSSVLQDAWFIPDVLSSPSAIWRGLERVGSEDFLVYAGIPCGDYAANYGILVGEDITIYPGFVFLVFVSRDNHIAKFRWEESDPVTPAFPIDYETRFRERLWEQQR